MRAFYAAKVAGGIAVFALGVASAADLNTSVFQDGKASFVVSRIAYALSKDANETGACPNGMTKGNTELFSSSPPGQRHDGESDQDYGKRVAQGALGLGTAPNGQNLCLNPEAGAPDPNFHTVTGKDVPADGIDLDGQDSHLNGKAAPGKCAFGRRSFLA